MIHFVSLNILLKIRKNQMFSRVFYLKFQNQFNMNNY